LYLQSQVRRLMEIRVKFVDLDKNKKLNCKTIK
jgi:hypothetical protein